MRPQRPIRERGNADTPATTGGTPRWGGIGLRDDWASLDARTHRDPRREAGERGVRRAARSGAGVGAASDGLAPGSALGNAAEPDHEADGQRMAGVADAARRVEKERRGRVGDAGGFAAGTRVAGTPRVELGDDADFQVAGARRGLLDEGLEADSSLKEAVRESGASAASRAARHGAGPQEAGDIAGFIQNVWETGPGTRDASARPRNDAGDVERDEDGGEGVARK